MNPRIFALAIIALSSVLVIIVSFSNFPHKALAFFSLPFELAGNSQGHIVANGLSGSFDIFEGDNGNLTGTVFNSPVVGIFDNSTGKVSFILVRDPIHASKSQFYTGYIVSQGGEGGNFVTNLAGTFEEFLGTNGTSAHNNAHGWYATIAEMP